MTQDYDEDDAYEPEIHDGGYLCANCEATMPPYHAQGSLCPACEMDPDRLS